MDDRYFAIIPAVFVLFCTLYGVMLLCGKWSKAVPGYGAKASDKNAAFFEKIVCKYVGVYVLILTVFFALIFVGLILQIGILGGIAGGIGAAVALIGYIAIINSTRFKRALYLAKNLEKFPKGLSEEEIEKWRKELGANKHIKE